MTGTRRLLFLAGCLCCLLVVASALPAADPRIDRPGEREGEPLAGDWEAMEETPDFSPPEADETDDRDDGTDDSDAIEVDGAIEPGNEVTVDPGHHIWSDSRTISINGENVTETGRNGTAKITVPYAEEMTVAVPAENRSRTFDVPTDATIEPYDAAAPARNLEISAAVGSTPVANATVTRDGEVVATTDEDGVAMVPMPETAGSVTLRVERGPVEGGRTVEVAEPSVRFVSPLLFPGGPASVQVSADGRDVSNARVSLESGGSARTGDDGRARIWLPIGDEATVTAEVGNETATATVGNLYLRLTAVAVFVPGFCIGGVLTYFRLVAAKERRRGTGVVDAGLFLALADFFASLSDGFVDLLRTLFGRGRPSLSLPRPSFPRLEFGGIDRGFPSIGPSLASFGRAFGTLPSLGSLVRSPDRERDSALDGWLGTTDDDAADDSGETTRGDDGPGLATEPLAPRGPRAEVREAWHAFVDRLEVDDRSTVTPGEVGGRALDAGFPADRVDRLVSHVRDIEYGGHSPSPERVAAVWETVSDLLASESDEEGSA